MAFCPKCRVEVRDQRSDCPLCGAPLQDSLPEGPAPAYPDHEDQRQRKGANVNWTRVRRIFTELFSLGFVISLGLILFSDYWEGNGLSWSYVPASAVIFAYGFVLCWVFGFRRPGFAGLFSMGWTLGLLALLDFFLVGRSWFIFLGLPVTVSAYLLFGLAAFLIAKSKRRGFNIPAYLVGASGLLCLVIDLAVSLFNSARPLFSWSIIVLMALVPTAMLLGYLHIKVKNFSKWKRFFHI